MKDIFVKVGQWCAVVLRAIGALLTKCENWIWRAEDRLPWIRNTYHAVRRFFQTIGSTLDAFCAKLAASFRARRKMPVEKAPSRLKSWADRIGSRLPKNKALFGTVVVEAILAVWGLVMGADILFIAVILLWCAIVIYAAVKMEQRAMLLMLSLTFFVFLLGRLFLEQFFCYRPDAEIFPAAVQTHTYICLFVALLGLFLGYWFIKRKTKDTPYIGKEKNPYVLRCAKYVLLLVLIPAVLYRLILTVYVQRYGYNAYYTDFAVLLDKNILLYVLSKVEQMAPACFCIYLAAMPAKKEFFKVSAVYAVYLVLTLGAGTRSPFLLGVFLFFFYFLYRAGLSSEERWFNRRYIAPCVAILAVFAIALYVGGLVRDGAKASGNAADGLFGFVYSQGVSVNVIRRGFMLKDQIPEGYLYSMDFTRYGIIARLLGIPVYAGNTAEQALYGGSFAHALSYVFMQSDYLAGRGTGTSYVAELFHDFWYVGVFVGSVLYGWLCTRIESYKTGKVFRRACLFIVITQLLWAPRGGFTKFITTLISPSALVALIAVFGLTWLLGRRKQWRLVNAKGETHGKEKQ
ncbi:MAG: O-antigen polysaccharide polymerase Wzy [Ruminococcaceae bacterium]|nr:O-antigen polysaccharide polymerase Wzy [Oscillospiraceae bacterium]